MNLKLKIISFFCLVTWLICPIAFAEKEMPGNFENPAAVKEVLSGKRTVVNAAWWGFNKEDGTAALQAAINSGASKIIVPYMGSDWIVRPIKLSSNQEIVFEPGVVVVAKKGEFRGRTDCLFSAVGKKSIILRGYGATLKMQKEDYANTKIYQKAEYRHIISLHGSTNVKILGLRLESSGGDGIYVGAAHGDIACSHIQIKDCICDNNYRQGLSIISAENMLVENCVFKNTNGTPPSAGIDIEPNSQNDKIANIVISNCISTQNSGNGFQLYLRHLSKESEDVSILFVNCYVNRCDKSGIVIGAVNDNGPKGLINSRIVLWKIWIRPVCTFLISHQIVLI